MRCGFFTRQIQRLEMSEPKAGRKFKKANEQSRNRLDGPVQCDVVTESVLLYRRKMAPILSNNHLDHWYSPALHTRRLEWQVRLSAQLGLSLLGWTVSCNGEAIPHCQETNLPR